MLSSPLKRGVPSIAVTHSKIMWKFFPGPNFVSPELRCPMNRGFPKERFQCNHVQQSARLTYRQQKVAPVVPYAANAADRLTASWFAIEKQENERNVRDPKVCSGFSLRGRRVVELWKRPGWWWGLWSLWNSFTALQLHWRASIWPGIATVHMLFILWDWRDEYFWNK